MAQKKPQGHYCKVCGQRKANEKFSGKGHASHICKACAPLSAAEKAESMTMLRLENLAMRRLSRNQEQQVALKKWLQNRTRDKRPAVKELAKEIYKQQFPFAEHNTLKKQLRLNEVEFNVNASVWDEFGDEQEAHCTFRFNRQNQQIMMTDPSVSDNPQVVKLEAPAMAKLLKWMVHSLEVFCWEEDYCGNAFDHDEYEGFDDGLDSEEDACDLDFLFADEESEEKGEPTWSIHLKYSVGKEQHIKGYDDLPDRVELLYWELYKYFTDKDDEEYEDEFSFFEAAYGCDGLNELADLVAHLLADAEESGCEENLGIALVELTTFSFSEHPAEEGKRPYQTHSGASANIKFMQSFISQIHPELGQAANGKERLAQFVAFVKDNFTPPVGDSISVSDLDKTMAAIEKRYKLISRFSKTNRLRILRIRSSHKAFNSICNSIKSVYDSNKIQYELYLFNKKDPNAGHPAYILLHELGHILQIEITHDPAKTPESFCKLSGTIAKIAEEQNISVAEIFADAFAMAMMQTFGWTEYDPFNMVSEETKDGFKIYMDRLIEHYLALK